MSDFINSFKGEFEKTSEHLKKELSGLRVGRATPALVENIPVLAYGSTTPLIHLASITVSDPKTIVVQPWDKNLLKDIEKAIYQAQIGSSPAVKENLIIVSVPPLSEEVRLEVVKKLNQKLEEARIAFRASREKVKEHVLAQEKSKQISEDEKFRYLEELDNLIKDYNEKIKELGRKKEEEIVKI